MIPKTIPYLDPETKAKIDREFKQRCDETALSLGLQPLTPSDHSNGELSSTKTDFNQPELPVERNTRAFEKKGLKPEMCPKHERILIFDCFSCPDEDRKLCYYCTLKKNGFQHKKSQG